MARSALLFAVFCVAFAMMVFELVFFQLVLCQTNYLLAVYSIAIALMGLIAGGVVAFLFVGPLGREPGRLAWAPIGMSVAVGLAILDLAWLQTVDVLYFYAGSLLVFVCAGVFISTAFAVADSYRVYAADMIGAGLGVVGAVTLVPLLIEENALLVSLALPLAAGIWLLPCRRSRRALGLVLIGAGLITVVAFNRDTAVFNIVRDARPNRFTNHVSLTRNTDEDAWVLTRSSMSGRLDFAVPIVPADDMPRAAVPENPLGLELPHVVTYINNRALDGVNAKPAADSAPDVRLPGALHAGKEPRILVVGAAAEGIVKPALVLGGPNVTAVEINPATIGVMTGELDAFSAHAYRGLDLYQADVRTFLQTTGDRYDIITLLNTHNFYVGYDPIPDYPFTVEAIRLYLEHLTPDGFIDIEEMIYEDNTLGAVQKELANFVRVLAEADEVDDPARHFYAYRWRRPWHPEGWWYYQFLVRMAPFGPSEIGWLDAWVQARASEDLLTEVLYRADPESPTHPAIAGALQPGRHEALTDDQPFNVAPFVSDFQAALNMMILVLLVLGLGVLAFPLRRFLAATRGSRGTWLSLVFFLCSGFAYMGFEIYMFQKNQLYIGSVGMSLTVSIAVMLIASGLGSLAAGRLKPRIQLILVACIPVAIALLAGLSSVLFDWDGFWFRSQLLRVVMVVLLVGPVCFLMGVPFAAGMDAVRIKAGEDYAAYMFAINGVAASLGAVLSFNLSLRFGFLAILWLAIGLYALVLVTGLFVLPRKREA